MGTGAKLYTFEGHAAPVFSVCPHNKENVHVRTSLDYCLFFFCASDLSPKFCSFLCLMYNFVPQFVFSTSIDGKIKAWLYDLAGSRVDYDAPGRSCTTIAYSADGKRLI